VIKSLGSKNAEEVSRAFKVPLNLVNTRFAALAKIQAPDPETVSSDEDKQVAAQLIDLARDFIELFRDQTKTAYVTYPAPKLPKTTLRALNSDADKAISTPHVYDPHIRTEENIEVKNGENSARSVVSVAKKTVPLSSDEFKRTLSLCQYEITGEAPTDSALRSAILVLAALADSEPIHMLYNRVAPGDNGSIWLDMADDAGRGIHITKNGWKIEVAPQIFRHYDHMLPLPEPVRVSKEGLEPILKYVNVKDIYQMLLAVVTPITYFDPEVPHVIMINYGQPGATKTSGQIFLRSFVDPADPSYNNLSDDPKELAQNLDHNYMPIYENISSINEEQSDILCKASTGMGQTQRALYTDDKDFIRRFRRCVCMNSLTIPGNRGDFMDRTVLFEIAEMEGSRRKTDREVAENMKKDAPIVLGAALNVLVKALNLRDDPDTKPLKLGRMADFHLMGCAITRALRLDKYFFNKAYAENKKSQDTSIIENSMVAEYLMEYMDYMGQTSLMGAAGKLKRDIEAYVNPNDERGHPTGDLLSKKEGWPKNSTWFGRQLTDLIPSMRSRGYYISPAHGRERQYTITKVDVPTDGVDLPTGQLTPPKLTEEEFRVALRSAGGALS
jgi:hypothetical protein